MDQPAEVNPTHDEGIHSADSEPLKRPHDEGSPSSDSKRLKTAQEAEAEVPAAATSGGSHKTPGKSAKSRKGKDRDTKNSSRRRSRNDEAAQPGGGEKNSADGGSQDPKALRLPKRAVALLIGFCGSGFRGMQIQPHGQTIENALFDAMVRAGAVSQDNANDPVKVGIGRSARTDAGVHAARNVVTLKMITTVPGVPDLVARINEELPPEIRLWSFVRVQNSFNPRVLCDSRKYTYFFPSYLLIPPKPGSPLHRVLTEHAASLTPAVALPSAAHPFWSGVSESSTEKEDLLRKRAWRVDAAQLEQLRAASSKYIATHNFHNFTVNGEFGDRSNQRIVKNMVIDDPAVYGETEWISVLFHGQSFMMHQRKMISVLVLSCRTGTPPQIIDELYGPRDVFIPKMPSLGLLLEEPIFDTYNTKVAGVNAKLEPSHADYRPPLDFGLHKDAIDAFKQKYIYDNMRMVEDRDGLFDAWIRMVDAYAGNDLLYLNPKGVIPPMAVVKGRHRPMAFVEKKLFDETSFPGVQQSMLAEEDEDEVQLDKRKRVDTEG